MPNFSLREERYGLTKDEMKRHRRQEREWAAWSQVCLLGAKADPELGKAVQAAVAALKVANDKAEALFAKKQQGGKKKNDPPKEAQN